MPGIRPMPPSNDRVPYLRRDPFAHQHGGEDHEQQQRHLRPGERVHRGFEIVADAAGFLLFLRRSPDLVAGLVPGAGRNALQTTARFRPVAVQR